MTRTWTGGARRTLSAVNLERALFLALVVSVSAASVVVAGNGVGAVFNIGTTNTVNATTILSGGASGGSLRVRNTANAPALDLRVPSGVAPMKVNSSAKVARLNADLLDDLDSADLQRRLAHPCGPGSAVSWIAEDGTPTCDQTARAVQSDLNALQDRYASHSEDVDTLTETQTSTCWLGEVRLFAGSFAPQDWMFTQGQLLPINQRPALFAVLGNRWGGNDTVFAMPDTREIEPAGMHYIMCVNGVIPPT